MKDREFIDAMNLAIGHEFGFAPPAWFPKATGRASYRYFAIYADGQELAADIKVHAGESLAEATARRCKELDALHIVLKPVKVEALSED